jgi:hypothetical protein
VALETWRKLAKVFSDLLTFNDFMMVKKKCVAQ